MREIVWGEPGNETVIPFDNRGYRPTRFQFKPGATDAEIQQGMQEILAAHPPAKAGPTRGAFSPTENGGFIQHGDGHFVMGLGGPETSPPPVPPEDELQQAANAPHRYPDIPQPPIREQHADDAAFAQAQSAWMQRYGATVARRNKFSKRRPKPPTVG
ncbi:MAG TPA: hypothetical protein VGN42_12970 [Pirellulales bacterium]|nr:hypothetical protein [Pirellulales bacterium]